MKSIASALRSITLTLRSKALISSALTLRSKKTKTLAPRSIATGSNV